MSELTYDVQPLWISLFIGSQAKPGIQNFTIKLSFRFNGQIKTSIERKFSIEIKNYLLKTDDSNKPMHE